MAIKITIGKKGRTIRATGLDAQKLFAAMAVNSEGEKALENTEGPLREAIQQELDSRKKDKG
jgi:hypothetical protein